MRGSVMKWQNQMQMWRTIQQNMKVCTDFDVMITYGDALINHYPCTCTCTFAILFIGECSTCRYRVYFLHLDMPTGSPADGDALSEGSGTEDNVHISSPIRVSPERREPRVVQRSPRCEEDGRLSAKERLYVSKNAIGKYTND